MKTLTISCKLRGVQLGLLGLGLLSQLALAGQSVDRTLATVAAPFVKIEHINGKAEIKTWDREEVKVTGELGDRTKEFTFVSDGDEVIIVVEVEKSHFDWKFSSDSDEDDLTVFVPAASRLRYESVNAKLDISGITNSTHVEVINGKVTAKDLGGKVNIDSVNGDINFNGISGDLLVTTVNGDIRGDHTNAREARFETVNGGIDIATSAPDVVAETVNGNIELDLNDINELLISTVNGRATAAMNLMEKGEVSASSVGGKIELVFQENVSARFNIEAHAGGSIRNQISSEEMKRAKYGPRRWLEFSYGGGSGRVEVSTVSGNIVLESR